MTRTAVSDDDAEGDFYRVMSALGGDAAEMVQRVRKDMFDASQGSQVGLTADGSVGLLLVTGPAQARMLARAFMDYVNRGGGPLPPLLLGWLSTQALMLYELERAPRSEGSDE